MNIKTFSIGHFILILFLLSIHVFVFDYPLPIIFSGIFVVSSLYLGLLWLTGIVSLFFKKDSYLLRLVIVSLFTLTTCSIILVFIVDYVGNSNWGTNFTFGYIVKYAQQVDNLKEILPIPLEFIYLFIGLFFIATFSFYYKITPLFLQYIAILTNEIVSKNVSFKKATYTFLSFLVFPFFLYVYSATQADTVSDMWDGEPLTDLFLQRTYIDPNSNTDYAKQTESYVIKNQKDIHNKPNIILIIADALRADHLGSYGYHRKTSKFIDNLVANKQTIKIKNAFSTCAESNCGIISTLSSRPFDEINPKNTKINNVLKSLGYDINFILSSDHSWSGLSEHYSPYDLYYDGGDAKQKFSITDDELVVDKLASLTPSSKPTFFYFHLMSNHPAAVRKKQFVEYTPYKNPNDWFYRLPIIKDIYNTDTVSLETNFYDNGIIQTDFIISKIFKQLKKKGYLKNSIIWIIADHGEGIGEHGHFGHIGNLYNEEMHIPMIIVDSKPELYEERNFATQLDFAPTILDRLGVEIPKGWKGKSLLKKKQGVYITRHNVPNRKGDKAIIIRTNENQLFKMLYNDKNNDFKVTGIFNLTKDMAEKDNLNTSENQKLIDKFSAYAQQELKNTQVANNKYR